MIERALQCAVIAHMINFWIEPFNHIFCLLSLSHWQVLQVEILTIRYDTTIQGIRCLIEKVYVSYVWKLLNIFLTGNGVCLVLKFFLCFKIKIGDTTVLYWKLISLWLYVILTRPVINSLFEIVRKCTGWIIMFLLFHNGWWWWWW